MLLISKTALKSGILKFHVQRAARSLDVYTVTILSVYISLYVRVQIIGSF